MSATTPRIRTDLDAIPAYVPGKSAPDAIKLASNEASDGPLPEALEAVARAAAGANRYPDMSAMALREELAERHGTTPDHIATGCGSSALCQQIIQATCTDGDEVVFPWRSFEAYPILTRVAGAVPVQVPLAPDHSVDLEAMAAAVTKRTRLIFVCTPNNPSGPAIGTAQLEAFLDRVPAEVTVALDEAYFEYNRLLDRPDGFAIALARPNVVAMRTMSKAYGLAGLRVGYLAGPAPLVEAVNKMQIPFAVSAPAQAAAIASLRAEASLLARTDAVVAERERTRARLAELPSCPAIPPSEANFLWLPLGDDTARFVRHCADAGVLVRGFDGFGARVSIGTPEEMDVFCDVAAGYFGSSE